MAIETKGNIQQILQRYDTNQWMKDQKLKSQTSIDGEGFAIGALENGPAPKSFGEFLKESVVQVNDLQGKANVAIQKLATGESKNIHETLLLVEQADLAFKTMNQVRLKVIDAYKEVMKMQV
jgi:flagellar hook-basal body complex protein FliE